MNLTNPIANPYVGPETFTQAQGKLFFGREREARDLLSRVLSERLVLFYAQSGAGKSSLLNARLIPSLREVGYAVLPVTRVGGELPADIDQVDNIYLFNLMLRIDKSTEEASRFAHVELGDFLHGLYSDDGEHFVFDELAVSIPDMPGSDTQPVTPYVLIIDQFEEIITAHPGRWKEREAFFRQLDTAMRRDPNLWVILTLREDYVPSIEPYAPLLLDRMRARFYMERMGVDAALEAVRRPAEMGGRPFDSGVAERLVDNLRQVRVSGQQVPIPGQYVEPVQLQVVCYQLWEKIRHRPLGSITEADRQEAGDVDQALGHFYENALGKVIADPALDVSERQLRTWFDTQLITEAGTRGTVFQGEESTAGLDNKVVDVLESRRLLRKEVRAGGVWVELIHDRFVEPIRETNRLHATPLSLDAEDWQEKNEDPGLFYTGSQLSKALHDMESQPDQYSLLERKFIEAAQKHALWRSSRYKNLITYSGTAIILLLAFLTVFSISQAEKAENAQMNAVATASAAQVIQLTAESNSKNLATAVENLGILLARQAFTVTPTPLEGTPAINALATPTTAASAASTPTPDATIEAIQMELSRLQNDMPVRTTSIGASVKGKLIEVTQFGTGTAHIVLIGGLHSGSAPSSVALADQMIDYFTTQVSEIPGNLTLHIVANANPDSQDATGRLEGRVNANLVDLNRNWDCNWKSDAIWSGSAVSGGTEAFSEPESKALRDYIVGIKPVAVVFWEAKGYSPGSVTPGGCNTLVLASEDLAQTYKRASNYDIEPFVRRDVTGDATNWLDATAIPAISVLLPDYSVVDWEANLGAVRALLEKYGR